MVFKTILNTTSQVPIYHPNRVALNSVLDGIRLFFIFIHEKSILGFGGKMLG
jgi:hypothetical protein